MNATTTEIILSPSRELQPAPLFTPTPQAAKRVLEFFTAQINNDHTRKAYLNATRRFAEWCDAHGIARLADVEAFHVAAFVKDLQGEFSAPTVKQHLAALRMLFDWLVTGHVLDVNPAHAVRGPKYVVRKGKTPVLTAEEARELARQHPDRPKDRSSTAMEPKQRNRCLSACAIGRSSAPWSTPSPASAPCLRMRVRDYFVQGRRGWVRLHEKGGKEHVGPLSSQPGAVPRLLPRRRRHCREISDGRFIPDGRRQAPALLTAKTLWQQDAYRMIQRRAKAAGIQTRIGNHTFRATGITAYLKNHGTLETAQHIANHESPRTTMLYDRRQEEISLDEVERIAI